MADAVAGSEVTTLDDLWEGELMAAVVDGLEVIVVNVAGEISAFHGRCPHNDWDLGEATFDGETLTCAAHNWRYRATDGGGVNPAGACLRRYAVQVVDDVVYVDVTNVLQERRTEGEIHSVREREAKAAPAGDR